MNCPRCGAPVVAGQTHCACGQYLPRVNQETDMPSEFYARIERRVEQSGKNNFRRGLLIGLGCLALFLFLELIMDTVFIGQEIDIGIGFALVAAIIGVNIWLLVRRYLM